MKYQILFYEEKKENHQFAESAEVAQRVVKVNTHNTRVVCRKIFLIPP